MPTSESDISTALPRGPATRTLFLITLFALGACQTMPPAPQQVELSEVITATLEVVSIDPAERLLTLRREDGMLFDLNAGEEVRNFNQIAVGDALRVRYEEKLRASVVPEGEGAPDQPVAGWLQLAQSGVPSLASVRAWLSVCGCLLSRLT